MYLIYKNLENIPSYPTFFGMLRATLLCNSENLMNEHQIKTKVPRYDFEMFINTVIYKLLVFNNTLNKTC